MLILRSLVLCAASVTLISSMSAERPFDFAATPGKLPKHVVPQEYKVRITPDIEKLTFAGEETIRVDVRQPSREIVLNAADISVSHAAIDGVALPASAIESDQKNELLTLRAPEELPAGPHEITLRFSGKINARGQGLYHAPYVEQGTGVKKTMLGTQFEATDARRMFPCWDEPAFRARFQLTAVVPAKWTAVSNMPIENETETAEGKVVEFGTTPPMPSYLNVLCAGELDFIETESSGVRHRVFATQGKADHGKYALDSAVQVTNFYNEYFAEPYPLPKLDEIAVPGGFGGAMENWGGITYFESRLLYDPESSSVETRQNIYEVVAHEIAHQWFGNLVTMGWWDNLWLNEGFASWMGSKCTEKFNPQWEVWLAHDVPRDPARRAGMAKETAMESDARSTTHPIQQPVKTEAEANSAFDEITYKKGQSFIRMLESFLGEEVFRDGIRLYIQRHKYSNTTTQDLWNALREVSGRPVGEIAAAWTTQPGFPLVQVSRSEDGSISLTQERFAVNDPGAKPLQWIIPLTYRVSGGTSQSLLMEDKTATIKEVPESASVKLNADGAGNYRVQYDAPSWQLLMQDLAQLSVADRVNLLADTWALVQAGRAPLSRYLELVRQLPTLTELAEREQIIHTFRAINGLIAGTPEQEKFQTFARGILRRSFDELGWNQSKEEAPRLTSLRASLVEALAALGDKEMIREAGELFERSRKDPKILSADLRPPILRIVGGAADEATWNTLHELGKVTTSIEQKQNYYDALVAARDPKLAKRALQLSLTDELPASSALFLVSKVSRDGGHPDLAWKFAAANMKTLLAKSDALAVNNYAPGLFTFFSDPKRVDELKAYAKEHLPEGSAPAVAKAIDEITYRSEFRKRLLAELPEAVTTGKEKR